MNCAPGGGGGLGCYYLGCCHCCCVQKLQKIVVAVTVGVIFFNSKDLLLISSQRSRKKKNNYLYSSTILFHNVIDDIVVSVKCKKKIAFVHLCKNGMNISRVFRNKYEYVAIMAENDAVPTGAMRFQEQPITNAPLEQRKQDRDQQREQGLRTREKMPKNNCRHKYLPQLRYHFVPEQKDVFYIHTVSKRPLRDSGTVVLRISNATKLAPGISLPQGQPHTPGPARERSPPPR